jgi:hypothetical protein
VEEESAQSSRSSSTTVDSPWTPCRF